MPIAIRRLHPHSRRKPDKEFPFFALLSWGVLVFLVIQSLALVMAIIRPFLAPLICAALLVIVFNPVHQRILKFYGGRKNLAATSTVVLVVVVVLLPIALLSTAIINQGIEVARETREWQQKGHWKNVFQDERVMQVINHPQIDGILTRAGIAKNGAQRTPEDFIPAATQTGARIMDQLTGNLIAVTGSIFGNIFINILNIGIALFALFYAFRDGPQMVEYGRGMIPLKATHERAILSQIHNVAQAIMCGIFLTASTQAVVAMIAFKIVGIPALFWGLVIAIASLIPVVGTAIVWAPMVVYLYFKGQTPHAIFLFLWCAFIVGSIDNFLRPYFMKGRSGMSTVVLFFSLIGGIKLYGPMGLIYGPMIFSICAVLLYIFRLENQEALRTLETR